MLHINKIDSNEVADEKGKTNSQLESLVIENVLKKDTALVLMFAVYITE